MNSKVMFMQTIMQDLTETTREWQNLGENEHVVVCSWLLQRRPCRRLDSVGENRLPM